MAGASTYQALADFLARKDVDVWDASFTEVERILRRALPRSAYQYQAWWANQSGRGHSQTHGWRSVGWRTSKLDLERKQVRFEREKAAKKRNAGSHALSFVDPALIDEAKKLTGISDQKALVTEGLRALIRRETADYLISLGGMMEDYSPGPRERPEF